MAKNPGLYAPDGSYYVTQTDGSGTVIVPAGVRSTTGTQSSVASSASSVTVLAANTSRLGASVYNDSTQILYLLLATSGSASTTNYTLQMAPSTFYEVPFDYQGIIKGIWASANGNARVMEYT